MRSYLRQCYALYKAGPCHALSSPMSTPSILAENMDRTHSQYVGVDAKGFDHQIPLWFVEEVMKMVGRVGGCEDLMDEEISELRTLKIELFGTMVPYRGGVLLVLWRMTSLIGTMASELLSRWCARSNDISWMVQGDDVLIMGRDINSEKLREAIDQMRLVLKDPLRIKRVGTFLQRTFGEGTSLMSFGRALKQIFYANPWVDRLQFADPMSLSNSWLQLISRIPGTGHRTWMLHQAAADLARWARWKGWDKQRWYELLTTDSGFGGLGTIDTHITRPYIPAIRTTEVTVPRGDGWRKFLSIVAPEHKQTKQEMNRQYRFVAVAAVHKTAIPASDFIRKTEDNITEVLYNLITNGIRSLPRYLKTVLPKWLRA
ncbi:unnamed protein product [Nippostrongylus brasiliensis]|uniref:RNA-dependent RNA polymerase n=1 Tax=Nippostrongylus brasiliensis TaxID=27835 RepID=A0A0N4XMI7_NIPBR|nr:unnamed protein product [Nippostrongylus brasiliensis]